MRTTSISPARGPWTCREVKMERDIGDSDAVCGRFPIARDVPFEIFSSLASLRDPMHRRTPKLRHSSWLTDEGEEQDFGSGAAGEDLARVWKSTGKRPTCPYQA